MAQKFVFNLAGNRYIKVSTIKELYYGTVDTVDGRKFDIKAVIGSGDNAEVITVHRADSIEDAKFWMTHLVED
jgi:hypothetical protein